MSLSRRSRSQLALSLLPLAWLACQAPPPPSHPEPEIGSSHSEITGGVADLANITGVVKLQGFLSSSGTLLSPYWVLTSKHQFDPTEIAKPSIVTVTSGVQSSKAAEIFTNPSYDIALVRLATRMIPPVVPILLHRGATDGAPVICSGYGETYPGDTTGTLTSANFVVLSHDDEFFVIGNDPLKRLPASGDSGGPCIILENGYRRVAGVMKGGRPPTFTVVNVSRIENVDKWIARKIYEADVFDTPNLDLPFTGAGYDSGSFLANVNGTAGAEFINVTSSSILVHPSDPAGFFYTPVPTPLTGTGWDAQAHFAEVTGDGKSDFVFTGGSSIWVAPATTGNKFGAPIETALSGSGWHVAAKLADLNGDGLTDFVFAGDDTIWGALADGTGHFPKMESTPLLTSGWLASNVRLAPIDSNPGDDYVYLGSSSIFVASSLGNGKFSKPEEYKIGIGSGWGTNARLADLNGDGLADWVAVSGNAIYEKLADGKGGFHPIKMEPIEWGTGWDSDFHFADVNGDKRADFIFTARGPSDLDYWVKLAYKDGSFAPMLHDRITPVPFTQLQFGDITGDGKADAALISYSRVVFQKALASGIGDLPVVEVPPGETPPAVPPIDIGKLDLSKFSLSRNLEWSPLGRLCDFIDCSVLGAAKAFKDSALGFVDYAGRAPRLIDYALEDELFGTWRHSRSDEIVGQGDIDGDGKTDLVLRAEEGLAIVGTGPQGERRLLITAGFGFTLGEGPPLEREEQVLDVADYDGDRRADLLLWGKEGLSVVSFAEEGRVLERVAFIPQGESFGFEPLSWDSPPTAFGDYDGDGRRDFVFRRADGFEVVHGVDRGKFETTQVLWFGSEISGTALDPDSKIVATAHLEDPRRTDLILRTKEGLAVLSDLGQRWLEGTRWAPLGEPLEGGWVVGPEDEIRAHGDLDGDGRDELVLWSPWGWGVVKTDGDRLTSPYLAFHGFNIDGWTLGFEDSLQGLADVDGNGRAELVFRSAWGLGLLEWNDRGELSVLRMSEERPDPIASTTELIATGDFNGDGVAELVFREVLTEQQP